MCSLYLIHVADLAALKSCSLAILPTPRGLGMDVSEPADGTRKRKPSVRRQEAAGSSTAVSPELKKKSLVRPKKTIAVEDDSEDELGGAAQSQPKKPSQPPRKPRAKPAGTEPPLRARHLPASNGRKTSYTRTPTLAHDRVESSLAGAGGVSYPR